MSPDEQRELRRLDAAYDEAVEAGEVVKVTVTGGSQAHRDQLFAGIDFLAGGFPVEPVGGGRYIVRTRSEEERVRQAEDAITSQVRLFQRRAGRAAARTAECSECGAPPNSRCVTSGGKPRYDHSPRSAAERRAMDAVKRECADLLNVGTTEFLWRCL